MASFLSLLLSVLLFLSLFHIFAAAETSLKSNKKPLETYIVHVQPQSEDVEIWHNSFLPEVDYSSSDRPQPEIIYHYRHVFSGFAARLSAGDVQAMRQKNGFISARRERVLQLHTTRSSTFLGLRQQVGMWDVSNYGKGVIIGLLDTGINGNHPSFSDEGVPPPPRKWKGHCEFGPKVCNKKLIGARTFGGVDATPGDQIGHGTHTSSTAAGNFVTGANIFGNANGTAVGIAPHAHLAMYKVCSEDGCYESDIAAGMDTAIDDGVDVLSISLGGNSIPFDMDSVAIGAYMAVKKGIIVACSAGNSGPSLGTSTNEAPWILTVGASTIDRNISAVAVLGNGDVLYGETAFQSKELPSTEELPLVNPSQDDHPSYCNPEELSLSGSNFTGKIVMCAMGGFIGRIDKGQAVKDAGGAGMILVNEQSEEYTTLAEAHVLPAAHVSYADYLKIMAYLKSTKVPTAKILFEGTKIANLRAPAVAAFSSRGPSKASPGILKPDIIGPGVNILAAWHVSVENRADTKSFFNMISGTSMSCPHLAGVIALLKSSHPNWSPAAIKSAIMTTADQVNLDAHPIEDQRRLPASVFAVGSGHVNPTKANDPGLVYDLQPDEYIPYLCGLNLTATRIFKIVQRKVNCSRSVPEAELNYPSFSIVVGKTTLSYSRTVTNVGDANSTYEVKIGAPDGVVVEVRPAVLVFSKVGQKLGYEVKFSRSSSRPKTSTAQGFIQWNSAKHSVTSPIAVVFE